MTNESVSAPDDPVLMIRTDFPGFRQDIPVDGQLQDHVADQASLLGVQVAAQNWVVNMADIGGVLPVPPLTPVPLAKPWFMGVANVRGVLHGVTDMAAYRQQGKASGTAANRILLIADRHAFNAALLVDCVLGLRNVSTWEQHRVDGQMQYRDEQGSLWYGLDVADLLGQPGFLQIGR